MTNQFRPSVIDEDVPVFEGRKARRYSDGFETDYKVDLNPQNGKQGKHCAYCNRLAIWLFTPINPTHKMVGITFWRCHICVTKEEREIIIHTYYILGGMSTNTDTYGKRGK